MRLYDVSVVEQRVINRLPRRSLQPFQPSSFPHGRLFEVGFPFHVELRVDLFHLLLKVEVLGLYARKSFLAQGIQSAPFEQPLVPWVFVPNIPRLCFLSPLKALVGGGLEIVYLLVLRRRDLDEVFAKLVHLVAINPQSSLLLLHSNFDVHVLDSLPH